MDVNYDIWTGESIQELVQTIAEFRYQLLTHNDHIEHRLSDEINFLQHYFDSESCIVVANDCGAIVGYMALVDYSDHHEAINEYEHYGADLKISEGPWVHPDYRNMGIGKGLMQESLTICEIRNVSLLVIDSPPLLKTEDIILSSERIAAEFGFTKELILNKSIYIKTLIIE
jgi:GNAT superfamily N-acetyltransferase